MLTDRILPPEEWHRLEGDIAPLVPRLNPSRTVILVVEEDGAIVGRLLWLKADHIEGAWIAPSHRGKAAVLRSLWCRAQALIRASGGVTMIVAADRPDMATMLEKRGTPFPAQEYVICLRS